MSSTRNDNGQSPDTTSHRRMGSSVKNGVDSAHSGQSMGSGSYDQRRSHAYNEYGSGMPSQQPVQVNGDYMNYYASAYPTNDHYGGWTTGGGSGGFYHHHHPQAVNSPVTNAYMDNSTLFGGGNGPPPTDHSGYYYNYFPPTNGSDYNTWGTNFVTAPRTGGSSKHTEFYHSPANDYGGSGGYNRGGGSSYQLEQSMARMTVYDEPLPSGGGSGGSGGGGNYHRVSSSISDAKKKSWASIAGQPAKSSGGMGLVGIGRGKGRGIPIGGVPGSAKSESYGGSSGGVSSLVDSSGFWAQPAPQSQQQSASAQRNMTAISSSVGHGQERRSPRAADSARGLDNGANWNASSTSRGNSKPANDYLPYSSLPDSSAYSKRRDIDDLNGTGAENDDGAYDDRIVDTKKPATNFSQRPDNGTLAPPTAFTSKISADDYNPKEFTLPLKGARFFVIKSYSEDDVHRSIKYGIWCSTEHGNKRLDAAYREREGKGPIYLLFSVNASGHFCGVAQMTSPLDYEKSSGVWAQDKWKGQFTVKWIYVKDVPNQQLRHIRLENNENKPVTNSRDTQEVPVEKGRQVLKIIHQYAHTTSLFDDFAHYEKRQEEENARKAKRGNSDDFAHYEKRQEEENARKAKRGNSDEY